MIKEIEVDTTLDILNKIAASGLPFDMHDGIMTITVDDESEDDLGKIAMALSTAKKITFKCVKMDGFTPDEIIRAIKADKEPAQHAQRHDGPNTNASTLRKKKS